MSVSCYRSVSSTAATLLWRPHQAKQLEALRGPPISAVPTVHASSIRLSSFQVLPKHAWSNLRALSRRLHGISHVHSQLDWSLFVDAPLVSREALPPRVQFARVRLEFATSDDLGPQWLRCGLCQLCRALRTSGWLKNVICKQHKRQASFSLVGNL